MCKVILRGITECLFLAVTMPIRILALAFWACLYLYVLTEYGKKEADEFSDTCWNGKGDALKAKVHWIKTGSMK